MNKKNTPLLLLFVVASLSLFGCSNTTVSEQDSKQSVKKTEVSQHVDAENKAQTTKVLKNKAEAPSENAVANTTAMSQEEIDEKLALVSRFEDGEKVVANNKPNEDKLFEENHYKQQVYQDIVGVWEGVKDTEMLKQMGLSEEEIATSRVEIGFMPNHDMQMRTFGMPAPEDTPFITTNEKGVTIMTGRYIIKDSKIKIYFGKDVMADQQVSINNKMMTLTPLEEDAGIELQYKKIKAWTLK